MYRPEARAEVVAALLAQGGAISDPSGHATRMLAEAVFAATGRPCSPSTVGALLRKMEEDGQLCRTTEGRRTLYIELMQPVSVRLLADAFNLLYEGGNTARAMTEMMVANGMLRESVEAFAQVALSQRTPSGTETDSGEPAALAREIDHLSHRHERLLQKISVLEEENEMVKRERDEAMYRVQEMQLMASRLHETLQDHRNAQGTGATELPGELVRMDEQRVRDAV